MARWPVRRGDVSPHLDQFPKELHQFRLGLAGGGDDLGDIDPAKCLWVAEIGDDRAGEDT